MKTERKEDISFNPTTNVLTHQIVETRREAFLSPTFAKENRENAFWLEAFKAVSGLMLCGGSAAVALENAAQANVPSEINALAFLALSVLSAKASFGYIAEAQRAEKQLKKIKNK